MTMILKKILLFGVMVNLGLVGGGILYTVHAQESNDKILLKLATLLRSSRKIVSDNQSLINEQRANKKFTGQKVIAGAKTVYAKALGEPFPRIDSSTLEGKLLKAELDAIQEVMDGAQELINNPDMGFKGFLPAVYAKKVAQTFNKKVGKIAYLKLTAPKIWVRNRSNRPDKWESGVIENKFKAPGWKKGKIFIQTTKLKGKQARRLIIPEYYGPSCLVCHGEPKGERDITGGKKEGGKLGDLGGAISTAIFIRSR